MLLDAFYAITDSKPVWLPFVSVALGAVTSTCTSAASVYCCHSDKMCSGSIMALETFFIDSVLSIASPYNIII